MAYLKEKFENDIFISYSHIDNEKLTGQAIGWIEQFYQDLRVSLWQSIGTRDIEIWWDDRRLDGSVIFDNAIDEGLKKSAILLCLNSPAYQHSDYCKRELDLFYTHASHQFGGLKAGEHSRILNLLLYNIPFTEWPGEFAGASGFKFHDEAEEDETGHRVDPTTALYKEQLQDLVDALVKIIKILKKPPPPPPEFFIFFSDVPDSLRNVRKRTIAEIEKEGFKIICDVPPPFEEEEHEKAVKEKIDASALAVHLLDQYPGREIEGEETLWYPQKQAEIGLQSPARQLIWVPRETDINVIEEEQYKNFLLSLENGNLSAKNIEYIRGSKNELATQIIDLAKELKIQQKNRVTNERVSVLLDTHYDDQMYAFRLGESLLENEIQPFINPQEDDPLRNIHILEDRINQVSKLIFLYGKVALEWIIERMNAARQLIVTKKYPEKDFYVLMIPPFKDPGNMPPLNRQFIKVNVINNSNTSQLNTEALQQFFKSLKAAP